MPKITSKGQITIPQEIRNKFGFLPGMEVNIVAEDNKAFIIKNSPENAFMKWLGRGGQKKKEDIDELVNNMRGKTRQN